MRNGTHRIRRRAHTCAQDALCSRVSASMRGSRRAGLIRSRRVSLPVSGPTGVGSFAGVRSLHLARSTDDERTAPIHPRRTRDRERGSASSSCAARAVAEGRGCRGWALRANTREGYALCKMALPFGPANPIVSFISKSQANIAIRYDVPMPTCQANIAIRYDKGV